MASFWNKKARRWVDGRRNLLQDLEHQLQPGARWIWFHCASAGEFEQAKPIIEAIRKAYPHKILVSFFSPSGMDAARNYAPVDAKIYLPIDKPDNAEEFLNHVRPELVIFVKYEFWVHHLAAINERKIPLLLVSAVFRPDQPFFKWYGGLFRQTLRFFDQIFVQDENSQALLASIGITKTKISGDTRFDRVQEIADKFSTLPQVEGFINNEPVLIAGSTWRDDEMILANFSRVKLIIAPHEIDEAHIREIEELFPLSLRYSALGAEGNERVLIIDNIGMLSRLYAYATVCYIGGGFSKDGIHNCLEAAVYSKPVIFGPNFKKYREAEELIQAGGGKSFSDAESFRQLTEQIFDTDEGRKMGERSRNYVQEHIGATSIVMAHIQENRLLTS